MSSPALHPTRLSRAATWTMLVLVACVLLPGRAAFAKEYASDPSPGIEEKLGETIPLDLVFNDEEGKPVSLRSLIKRPTILTLVYFRCPSICSPLMHEVARTVDRVDLVPGVDFDLVTVSFDARETHEMAKPAKEGLLGAMKRKIPPDSWRFLTGDPIAITKLADAVGFRFKRDGEDFAHAGTVIFLTNEGMIVRYLGGLKLLPFDLKMAVLDAAEGHPRSVFQRIQKLCYAYDRDGKTYVLQINKIILFVTVVVLGMLLLVLLLKRRKHPVETPRIADSDADAAREGTS